MSETLDATFAAWKEAIVPAVEKATREAAIPEAVAEQALGALVAFPPAPPAPHADLAILHGTGTRAVSRKPANIVLRWGKLARLGIDVGTALTGAAAWWQWALIGLAITKALVDAASEDLGEVEATTIYALWKHRDGHGRIPEDEGFARTNEVRASHGLPALPRARYDAAINRLLELQCLELDAGVVVLAEEVRIRY